MRIRRRRRRKFLWLPTLGLEALPLGQAGDVYWDTFSNALNADGSTTIVVRDLVPDFPVDATNPPSITPSITEFIRSGYILRRVVGNIYCHIDATSNGSGADSIAAVAVTYGMFVARTEQNNPLVPVGAVAAIDNYGPQDVDCVREPWLFHRNFILSHPPSIGAIPNNGETRFPATSAGYGSAFEGSFVDQKTLRRVDGDDRLFHVVQVRPYPINRIHNGAANIITTVMFRLLGRPVAMRQTGAF